MKKAKTKISGSIFGAVALVAVVGLSGCGEAVFEAVEDDRATRYSAMNLCEPADCAADEACTQGGRCVNITGERDAAPVLQADIDELAGARGLGVPYRLPANAILRLDDADGDGTALHIRDKMIFEGAGSLLVVEDDAIAIRVAQPAEWAMLRNFRIDGAEPSVENESIGIDIRAHGVRLDNIQMWRVGTGVRAHTTIDGDYGNVNTQQWARLTLNEIYHRAMSLRAGDANAGLISSVDMNGGAGIYDRSFLGNTHIGINAQNTHTQSVHFDSAAGRNTLLGAHIGDGDPAPRSGGMHDLFIGGNAISRIDGSGDRMGAGAARLNFADPDSNHESGNPGMSVKVPGSPNAAISWEHPGEDEKWYLRFWDNSNDPRWGLSYRNTGTAPFYWTGGGNGEGPGVMRYGSTVQ